jgi:parallel beta-helix repeat protein
MKSCVIAVMIALLVAGQIPIEAQTPTPQYMPKTGGGFTGPVTTVQVNGTYTPATSTSLQTIVTAAGASSDVWLPCGVFNQGSLLTLANSGVHFHGVSYLCTTINFTTTAGLQVAATGIEIDNIRFQGATGQYTIVVTPAAVSNFKFHDNFVTGSGTGASLSTNAALWLQAPLAHVWIERNIFTGNGAAFPNNGYTVLVDGSNAGYVSDVHFDKNLVFANVNTINFSGFNCVDCEVADNYIDQNNQISGGGSGYGILIYAQGYASAGLTSIARVSNQVTAVQAGSTTWTYAVGQRITITQTKFGTNGTNFNGVFQLTAATLTGPGWTLVWSQTAIDDSVSTPSTSLTNAVWGAKVHGNTVRNTGGTGIYVQSGNDFDVSGNYLYNTDLQQVPGSLQYGAINVIGINGTVAHNTIVGVGVGPGIALANSMNVATTGNTVTDVFKQGIQLTNLMDSTIDGNTVKAAAAGGIIGSGTGTATNAFKVSMTGNDVWTAAGSEGIDLLGTDVQVSITGGSIHGPPSGVGASSQMRLGVNTSFIKVDGVHVDCRADNSTTVTQLYGIRSQGTNNSIRNNVITGCSLTNGAGIADFAGVDTVIKYNRSTNNYFGVQSTGTRPQIAFNELWGNSSAATSTGGATTPFISANQTLQAGGIDFFNSTLGFQIAGSTVIPSVVTGFQGSTGTKVGLTLGAMVSGNLRSSDANGNEVDAGLAATAPTKSYGCGTTSTCSASLLASPHTSSGQVTLSGGTATITAIPAYTSTTTFNCSCTDGSAAAACRSQNISTTSITLTGTGTDTVGYICMGN